MGNLRTSIDSLNCRISKFYNHYIKIQIRDSSSKNFDVGFLFGVSPMYKQSQMYNQVYVVSCVRPCP